MVGIENTFVVPQVQHVPMEPHVSIARLNKAGKIVVFFATKIHWRDTSDISYIDDGLVDLILRPGIREITDGHIGMIGTAIFFAVSYLTAKRMADEVKA